MTRFDLAPDRDGSVGDEAVPIGPKTRAVIRHQNRAKGDQLQRQSGFSTTRLTTDHHSAPVNGDSRGVKNGGIAVVRGGVLRHGP